MHQFSKNKPFDKNQIYEGYDIYLVKCQLVKENMKKLKEQLVLRSRQNFLPLINHNKRQILLRQRLLFYGYYISIAYLEGILLKVYVIYFPAAAGRI